MAGIVGALKRMGRGFKVVTAGVAITGTGTITIPGIETIEVAVVSCNNSGSAIPTSTVSITGIVDNKVSVVVTKHEAAANSIENRDRRINVVAVGPSITPPA